MSLHCFQMLPNKRLVSMAHYTTLALGCVLILTPLCVSLLGYLTMAATIQICLLSLCLLCKAFKQDR